MLYNEAQLFRNRQANKHPQACEEENNPQNFEQKVVDKQRDSCEQHQAIKPGQHRENQQERSGLLRVGLIKFEKLLPQKAFRHGERALLEIRGFKPIRQQVVAIKLMKNIFGDSYQARKTLREIKILRKLSRIPNNLFTTGLLDVILPSDMKVPFHAKTLNNIEE